MAATGAPRNKMYMNRMASVGMLSVSCSQEFVLKGRDNMSPFCYYRNFWFNTPDVVDVTVDDDVANPKDIVQEAFVKVKPLTDQISASLFEIQAMSLPDDPEDVVDAISLSILLIRESVGYMETVVATGKEIEEADKKFFILNLLSAIFLLISMGGSLMIGAGLTAIGRAFVLVGEIGGIGQGAYDIVENPNAAFLDLVGILFSIKGIRDAGAARTAAVARRRMADDEIIKINENVFNHLKQVSLVSRRNARGQICTSRYGS